jgi:hypothetical protein
LSSAEAFYVTFMGGIMLIVSIICILDTIGRRQARREKERRRNYAPE